MFKESLFNRIEKKTNIKKEKYGNQLKNTVY